MQCDSAVFNDVLDKRHVGNSEVTEASQNVLSQWIHLLGSQSSVELSTLTTG